MTTLPTGWSSQRLGELFDKRSLTRLKQILEAKDSQALEIFLQEHRDELMAKQVLPKYLYYVLCHKFNLEAKA
jgi:hypothetical protein